MTDAMQKVRDALKGISGVPITPYDSAGAVDARSLSALIDEMAGAGVHNLMAAGNTGEFFALSREEIGLVHRTVIEATKGRSLVSAAVGRSLVEAKAMAREAAAMGADAVMSHHPMDPFAAPAAQARYFLQLADAASVPVIAYVRSDALSVADFQLLANHGNIAGIKFASPNLMLLAEVIRATRGAPAIWVCGLAEGWAPAFYAMGARGFTSGLVNVFPERSHAIHQALERGDFAGARHLIDGIAGFEALRTRYNNGANVTVVKAAAELLGRPVGPVRSPGLETLNAEEHETLRCIVEAVRTERSADAAAAA